MPGAILGQETCRAVPPDLPRFTTCRLIDHGSARFPTQCRAGASNHRKTLVIALRLSGASPYQLPHNILWLLLNRVLKIVFFVLSGNP